MKEKNDRRSFLKNLTISGLGVTAMPEVLLADEGKSAVEKDLDLSAAKKNTKYRHQVKAEDIMKPILANT